MSESRSDDNDNLGDLDPASAAKLDATYSDELDFPGLPQVLWQMDRFDRTNTLEEQLKQVEDRLRFLDSMTSERRALESRLGAHLDLALDYQELESKGDEAALIYEKFALTDEQIQQIRAELTAIKEELERISNARRVLVHDRDVLNGRLGATSLSDGDSSEDAPDIAEKLLEGVDGIGAPTGLDEYNAKIREQLPQQIADIKQRIQEIYDTYFDDGVQIRLVPKAIINKLNRDIRMTVAMLKRLGLQSGHLQEITGVNVTENKMVVAARKAGKWVVEMLRPREY